MADDPISPDGKPRKQEARAASGSNVTPPDGLNDSERRLIEAAATGQTAEFNEHDEIRASVLAALCCGSNSDWKVTADGVRIVGGRINGRLHLADRCIDFPLWLHNVEIRGGIDLQDSRTRRLIFDYSHIGDGHSALFAQGAIVEGGLALKYANLSGACDINSATIKGQFIANGTTFNNPAGEAINAHSSTTNGFFLNSAILTGACEINGAKINGPFMANGATFNNPNGNAIRADSSYIGSWFMRPADLELHGREPTRVYGMISLIRTHIAHDLDFNGAQLQASYYLAVAARGLVVEGSAYFEEGATVDGALHFGGAEIKGRLRLKRSTITSAFLARCRSLQPLPAQPTDAEGHASFPWSYHALDLSEAKVGHLVLPESREERPRGVVDLSRARIGTFTDFKAAWPPKVDRTSRACIDRPCGGDGRDADHLILDGFEYEHLDNPDGLPFGETGPVAKARIDWLHGQSREDIFDRLKPQPWRQLGKVLAAQGYEDDARTIAIERRVAQRYAKGMPRAARVLSRLLHLLADYGFNPWKGVGWSAVVVLVFALLYFIPTWWYGEAGQSLGANQRVFVRTLPADFVPAIASVAEAEKQLLLVYPAFDPLIYSLDVFLPLVDLGTERFWRANTTTGVGMALYYLSILEGIAGAVLLSLIVTGFTGLLTRDQH